MLSNCAQSLCKPFNILMTQSFKSGSLPSGYKLAKVKPMYKKGDKYYMTNYRSISLTSPIVKMMKSIICDCLRANLLSCVNDWTKCANKCMCLDPESLNDFLAKKFDEMVSSLKNVFSDLKIELVTSAENQIKNTLPEPKPVTSFSDILKKKTTPPILIESKNSDHDSVQTKSDLTSHINPLDTNLQFEKLKSTKKGGMIVGCTSAEQNQSFKKLVQEKIGNAYVIREFKGISPRVRILRKFSNFRPVNSRKDQKSKFDMFQ